MINRDRIRPRQNKNAKGMNKTEARYADLLEKLKLTGEIIDYQFEAVRFKLANLTYYTPDFRVVKPDLIEYHEIKGFLEEDANVKFKVAAAMFPEYGWKMIRWKNKTVGWETIKEA